jgi:hypothetical protein
MIELSPLTLGNAVIEDRGRTYIALQDAAKLFGMQVTDAGDDLYELK